MWADIGPQFRVFGCDSNHRMNHAQITKEIEWHALSEGDLLQARQYREHCTAKLLT